MKRSPFVLMSLMVVALTFRGLAASTLPEPGPEAAGLRLRLVVTPHPRDGKDGYDVQADLISVSREALRLRAVHWRSERQRGGFQEYLEAALSIESYPAIQPWLGQVLVPLNGAVIEPEYTIEAGQTLSVHWHAAGRHLKNTVSNPLEVQNPDFTESGLYSIHVSLVVVVAGRPVRLRSNEQLVPVGGSREAPKHTYGPLWWADEQTRTATLGLGSLDKVAQGDKFLIQSGNIGLTWTLTITNAQSDHSIGSLVPSQVNRTPAFPSRGAYAALIPKK
jgi:hypothetical protein